VQVLEDLQGVLPSPARGPEVTDRLLRIAQVGQRLPPLKNRSRADVREDAQGLLAAVNGRLELTTEPVHEAKACPRKGLAFQVADLPAHIQGVLACVQGQFEIAEDGVVTAGKGQGVCLAVPAS